MKTLGLYIHFAVCAQKCPYCDFHSAPMGEGEKDRYFAALCRNIAHAGERYGGRYLETVYLGGGTPLCLGAERCAAVIAEVKKRFPLRRGAEITVECNPQSASLAALRQLRRAGANRLSVGLQSGVNGELCALGRLHTAEGAMHTVRAARRAGFQNLSLDLMLGVPGQTEGSLSRSLALIGELRPEHLSAYMLKIEPGSAWGSAPPAGLDEDAAADRYLQTVRTLRQMGYLQYEISNFCRAGYPSRHNLRYWRLSDTLGLGPAAHSLVDGRRFYCPPDTAAFIADSTQREVGDGSGGGFDERLMMGLRLLREGVSLRELASIDPARATLMAERIPGIERAGLVRRRGDRLFLTRRGCLLENAVILKFL